MAICDHGNCRRCVDSCVCPNRQRACHIRLFPAVEGNRIYAALELPAGTSADTTYKAALQIQKATIALNDQFVSEHNLQSDLVQNVLSSVAKTWIETDQGNQQDQVQSNIAEIVIDILP